MSAHRRLIGAAAVALALGFAAAPASAETLRLLTWGGYAPDSIIKLFEEKYPDIDVEVTLSNNEEMVAKLRATGGAGFDLAQPGFNRVAAAQAEYDIYKPIDLSKIDTALFDEQFLKRAGEETTIDGEVYSVPHLWGTSGLVVDKSKAPEIDDWTDLCDPKYKGKTSMRLKRTILVGTAFALGEDPFAAYKDLPEYERILDKVADYLIACKSNVKQYWKGGDDLAAMLLSGEVVASETWDSTAFKLYAQNHDLVYVPPKSGAIAWIDTFTLPKGGEADDAAYKWINFVMQPEIVTMMSDSAGAIAAAKNGRALLPPDKKAAVEAAFTDADMANLRFAATVLPGVEDLEGKALEKIKAAASE